MVLLGSRFRNGSDAWALLGFVELDDLNAALGRSLQAEIAQGALVEVLFVDLDAAVSGDEDADRADLLEFLRKLTVLADLRGRPSRR